MSALSPPGPPEISAGTIEEILAAARAMEHAAVRRYQRLGNAMRQVGHEDVARVFEELMVEESYHTASVEQLCKRLLGGLPEAGHVRWILPETFGAEDAGSPALLTPYKALSIAVRSEERAFAFWTYVAAGATDPEVRDQAEAMARQELLHAAKFRVARRKAYFDERGASRALHASGEQPLSLEELRAEQARIESDVVRFLAAAADRLDVLKDPESAALLRDLSRGRVEPGQAAAPPALVHTATCIAVLFDVTGVLERVADRYLDLLTRSVDETMTLELQRLGDVAMSQVARVNQRFAEIDPELFAQIFATRPSASGSAG
jgi:rubrerythrin